MSATNELFQRWKAHKRITTDSDAAKELGTSHGAPHHWKQGRNASAAVIERMAKDLGEDPIPVILQAFAEASRDAADRKTLGRLARSLGAACLALALLPLWLPQRAEAIEIGTSINSPHIHYAKWLTARLRRVRAWWRDFLESAPCNPLASAPASR